MADIMIVDDNCELCEVYSEYLTAKGYSVSFIAENGQVAVDYYIGLSVFPDLILMDFRMPLKDGITASQEILQINRMQKIIFSSADSSVKQQVLTIGCIPFKTKPHSLRKLLENIIAILSQ